jgi:hypothetical protein
MSLLLVEFISPPRFALLVIFSRHSLLFVMVKWSRRHSLTQLIVPLCLFMPSICTAGCLLAPFIAIGHGQINGRDKAGSSSDDSSVSSNIFTNTRKEK